MVKTCEIGRRLFFCLKPSLLLNTDDSPQRLLIEADMAAAAALAFATAAAKVDDSRGAWALADVAGDDDCDDVVGALVDDAEEAEVDVADDDAAEAET